jgi:hypothetical protein
MRADELPRLCSRCAHFAAEACAPRRGVPPCAAPASRCLTTASVGAARDHHVACSHGERGLPAIRAASRRWVLALDRCAPHHVQSQEPLKRRGCGLRGCAECHLAGTEDLFPTQRRCVSCVAAPRAAVPNIASAGSAVATAPLIAYGRFMLLPGRPRTGGLACAAVRALQQADARTLRQTNARWRRCS